MYSTLEAQKQLPIGNRCLFFVLITINTLLLLLGAAILTLSIMFWVRTKQFDSFILSLLVLSIFMILITFLGYCCIRSSKTLLTIYLFIYTIIMLGVISLGILIAAGKDTLVNEILAKITESEDVKKDIKEFLETQFLNIGISFICLSVVLVIYILLYQLIKPYFIYIRLPA